MNLGGIFTFIVRESTNREPKLTPNHEKILPDDERESDQRVSANSLSSLSIARRIASSTPIGCMLNTFNADSSQTTVGCTIL